MDEICHQAEDFAPMARLNAAGLPVLPAGIGRPTYDRSQIATGIVHFGPGAFHRAHQADYFDRLLVRDKRWGICQVSLRSTDLRDAIVQQDGLYTLVELGERNKARLIGSVTDALVARRSRETVLSRLASPDTKAVTITVTENGYCLTPDGDLDVTRPEIRHDLADPRKPASLVGWLVEGLRARRAAKLKPFTTVSCDNLVDNGVRLKRAVVQFAGACDADLAQWIEHDALFPRTMVDSIVPATDDALRADVRTLLGVEDAWPVQRETFSQWVIEDLPGSAAVSWADAGVTLTASVAAYDRAKLRLLNGPHSTLAYVGLLRGHETVFEAMQDPALSRFVERLMREDIRQTLQPPADFDLDGYIDTVLTRFRNPSIRHLLSQIAWDGSQKLGPRLLGTISDTIAAGRPLNRLAVPIAAWMLFLRMRMREGARIVDPLEKLLKDVAAACENRGETDVPHFLALNTIFPRKLAIQAQFLESVTRAYDALSNDMVSQFPF
jgi:fructuronate reductase